MESFFKKEGFMGQPGEPYVHVRLQAEGVASERYVGRFNDARYQQQWILEFKNKARAHREVEIFSVSTAPAGSRCLSAQFKANDIFVNLLRALRANVQTARAERKKTKPHTDHS